MRRSLVLVALLVLAVAPAAAHVNHVSADPQVSPDGTVVVEAVFPAADGWLVLHGDDAGEPGEPIGATPIAGGSFITDYHLPVDRAVWRNWTGPRRLHVVLHDANGDGRFDPDEDPPRRTFDRLVADELALAAGPAARVGAEGFSPQNATAGRVTIRSVAMPADGTLVVRNGSATGPVVGRTHLSAGSHGPVAVALNDELGAGSAEPVTLFVGIERDGAALTVAGRPVGSTVGVRVPATERGAATETDRGADGHDHTHEHTDTSGPGLGLLAGLAGLCLAVLVAVVRR